MDPICDATIEGRLTKDPVQETTPSGANVTKFSLAVNKSIKKDGEYTHRTRYFDIRVWGEQGMNSAKYLTKGQVARISGELDYRAWEDEKGKHSRIFVDANKVTFGPKPKSKGDDSVQVPSNPPANGAGVDEDDIPF